MDPLLAEAHEALGMAYARDGQMEQSEKSFRRAIELDPNLSIAYDEFAMDLLLPLNRIGEALRRGTHCGENGPTLTHGSVDLSLRAHFG